MRRSTRQARRLTVVAASVLTAALAGLLVAVPLTPAPARAQPAGGCGTFTVGPGQWVSTGVHLDRNQPYRLSATKTLTVTQDVPQVPDPSRPGEHDIAVKKGTTFGPGGTEVQWGFGLGTLSGFSLVARTAEYPTKIGIGGEFIAGESGTLQLGIGSQRPPGGSGPEPADAGQVSGSFSVTLLAPCGQGQPAPEAAPAANSQAAACGVPMLSDQEMADIVARGKATGRSQEDVRVDLESLNRSRGGSGAATCPVQPPAGYVPPVNPTGPSEPSPAPSGPLTGPSTPSSSPPPPGGNGSQTDEESARLLATATIAVARTYGIPVGNVDSSAVATCMEEAGAAGLPTMDDRLAFVISCFPRHQSGLLEEPTAPPPLLVPPGESESSTEEQAKVLMLLTAEVADAYGLTPEKVDKGVVISCFESVAATQRTTTAGLADKAFLTCYGQMTGRTPLGDLED